MIWLIYSQLLYEPIYEYNYQSLSTINYLYGFETNIISTKLLDEKEPDIKSKITDKNITEEFHYILYKK